jgi:hypothetical protein
MAPAEALSIPSNEATEPAAMVPYKSFGKWVVQTMPPVVVTSYDSKGKILRYTAMTEREIYR